MTTSTGKNLEARTPQPLQQGSAPPPPPLPPKNAVDEGNEGYLVKGIW